MRPMYYAVGKTNRIAYELGANPFSCLLNKKFTSQEDLATTLTTYFVDCLFPNKCLQEETYLGLISSNLWSIDSEFEVVIDSALGVDYLNILIADSRFNDDRSFVGTLLSDHLA